MKRIPLLFVIISCTTLFVKAQQKASQHQLKKWVQEDSALSRRLQSLQTIALAQNQQAIKEDSLQRMVHYEWEQVAGSRTLRTDTTRVCLLEQRMAALSMQKAATLQRFDSLLVLLDSTFGVKKELEERIKAGNR